MTRPITFITGCARSGTSLTTGILGAFGLNLGQVNSLNENTRVREFIIKPHLEYMGLDPLGQHPLGHPSQIAPLPEFRQRVLSALGGADVYKCAKAAILWPLFVEHFPEARWVIVRRARADIIDSCERTAFMRKAPDWGAWVDAQVESLEQLKRSAPCIEVWPAQAIAGDAEAFRPVAEFLGLRFDAEAVRRAINPNLWKGEGRA